jgi:hypothetical protein
LTAINDLIVEFLQSNMTGPSEKIDLEDATAPALVQILKKSVETMVSLKEMPFKQLSSTGVQGFQSN